jgi:hypothetical protein
MTAPRNTQEKLEGHSQQSLNNIYILPQKEIKED